jgi:hypothetical protein
MERSTNLRRDLDVTPSLWNSEQLAVCQLDHHLVMVMNTQEKTITLQNGARVGSVSPLVEGSVKAIGEDEEDLIGYEDEKEEYINQTVAKGMADEAR